MYFASAAALFQSGLAENVFLLAPDESIDGTPIAVVWIAGEHYNASQYTSIAQAFQDEAAKEGYKAWIGIPNFTFTTPNPGQIDSHVKDAVKTISYAGFTGDNYFLAGHSLGGVMTQNFLKGEKTIAFKGQVLMASTLLRKTRDIQQDGTTLFDYPTPTLTIGGTKDGLMRITRIAESYYHQVENITPDQKDLFPVAVLEGVSHADFAAGTPPSFVQKNDLRTEVSEETAHKMVGQVITKFIKEVVGTGKSSTSDMTAAAMRPFVDAMIKEGSYIMKKPCYDDNMINPTLPTCLKGSPWVQEMAIPLLIGQLQNALTSIVNEDNFHSAEEVHPYHHPELEGSCPLDGTTACTIKHLSVTQNAYNHLNELDTGKQPVSAYEMRVKMKSSQYMHQAAGEVDASFEALDLQGDECQRIN